MIGNIVAAITDGGEVATDFESIATVTVGAGGAANIEFTSIPATYQHLQIRGIARSANAVTYGGLRIQVGNGSIDTGSNYNTHDLYGDGSTPTSSGTINNTNMYAGTVTSASLGANIFGVAVIDILDYANTNKNKTTRGLGGAEGNGSGYPYFSSGAWRSTSAINIIRLTTTSGNFVQHSTFALYGIKG
jgi:hypothetical protein